MWLTYTKNREEIIMRRRELLKAAGASVTALAAPRIGRTEKTSKLVFVPTGDISVGPGRYRTSCDAQSRLSRLRHALRHRYELVGPAANGRGPPSRGGRA